MEPSFTTASGPLATITPEHAQWAANKMADLLQSSDPNFQSALEKAQQNIIGKSTRHKIDPQNRKLNLQYTPIPNPSLEAVEDGDIVSDYFMAILDTIGLVFEMAGLGDVDEETNVSVEMSDEEMSLLRKTLNDFVDAYQDYHFKGDFASIKGMAKALWKVFGAIWHSIGKTIFDTFAKNMDWEDWLEDGLIALGTILAWLATGGVAFVGELILLFTNTAFTIAAWVQAFKDGTPLDFIEALINRGGNLSDQVVINQLYNPSVVSTGGYTFVFTNSKTLTGSLNKSNDKGDIPGIQYSYATDDEIYDILEGFTSIDESTAEEIAANLTTDSLPPYWHKFEQIPGAETNVSSPSAVEYNGKIYVFFKIEGTHISYCILNNPGDPENPDWAGPYTMSDSVNTTTAPAAVVFQNQLYVFYQGSGAGHIWFDVMNTNGWQGITDLSSIRSNTVVATSTTPGTRVLGGELFVTYKDAVGNNMHVCWLDPKVGWSPPFDFSDALNTMATPKMVVKDNNEVHLYYSGMGQSPCIFTHALPTIKDLTAFTVKTQLELWQDILSNTLYNTGFVVSASSPVILENDRGNIMFYSHAPGDIGFVLAPEPEAG